MAAGLLPTTNLLPPNERRKLASSIKKIATITGTTPIVLDELQLLPAMEIILPALSRCSSKREGIALASPSDSSSIESIPDLDTKKEGYIAYLQPPVARLRLAPEVRNSIADATRLRLIVTLTQPMSHGPTASTTAADDDTDSILRVKRSLSILISTSPCDTNEDPNSAHAARRRKMVKLVNVLGGPIPSALVFPPPGRPRDRVTRHARRRSRSVPAPPPSAYSKQVCPEKPSGPNKLVRRVSREAQPLPALTVELISRPRPLVPFGAPCPPPGRSAMRELRTRNSAVSSLGKSSSHAYSLKRRMRESSSHTSES
ncbi:hypothetical protein MKEN_01129300 [Mycena kentingensis (nom. inval.)]|nr:hypothetical protein MKEN_01129300 [Mycena kentingensis (nom. inval.)]